MKVLLDEVCANGWEPALPATAAYYKGEVPCTTKSQPRAIDEHVMRQIEGPENIARLPHQTSRTAVGLLIRTGLRVIDATLEKLRGAQMGARRVARRTARQRRLAAPTRPDARRGQQATASREHRPQGRTRRLARRAPRRATVDASPTAPLMRTRAVRHSGLRPRRIRLTNVRR